MTGLPNCDRSGNAEAVRTITRSSKARLVERVEAWARQRGRRWVIGGPRQWSHDELVSAVVRIERGEEP